ncbi:Uncharacterised protein [Janthinobacterium lividum]|nr:hypothetical protein JANLI_41900 [Janthinobacterium lividum]STS86139.1 Uncharacterised protein [Janthinobacterium lividum]
MKVSYWQRLRALIGSIRLRPEIDVGEDRQVDFYV